MHNPPEWRTLKTLFGLMVGIAAIMTVLGVIHVVRAAPSRTIATSDYVVDVYVNNQSGGDLTNIPVAINMQADNLVDNGFIQADAEDLIAVNTSETSLRAVAQGMTTNNVTWWLDVDSVADGSIGVFQFYMGDTAATRDQRFRFDGTTDTVTVNDDPDLDITDDLVLTSTMNAVAWPVSDTYLVNKSGAYNIGLRTSGGTRTVFGQIFPNATTTTTIRPTSDISGNFYVVGGCVNLYDCIDETVADDDVTYIGGDDTYTEIFGMGDASLPASTIISSVSLTFRARGSGGAGNTTPSLCFSSCAQSQAGTTRTPANGVYSTYTETIARPGGGNWSSADIDALQLRFAVGATATFFTQAYLVVTYYLPAVEVSATTDDASVAFTTGADYTVSITYDNDLGSNQLKLLIDGTTVANGTNTSDIVSNASNLVLGSGYNGYLDAVRINSIMAYDFEPDELAETQQGNSGNSWIWIGSVEDVSAGTDQDGTYSLTRDMTGITRYTSGVDLTAVSVVGAVPTPPNILGTLYLTPSATNTQAHFPLWQFIATPAASLADNNVTPALSFTFLVVNVLGLCLSFATWKLTGNELLAVLPWVGLYWIGWQLGLPGMALWMVLMATLVGVFSVLAMRHFARG